MTAADGGFGSDFTLGVEEELFLVDPHDLALAPVAAELLPQIDAPDGLLAHEAFAAEIELRTPPLAHAGEAPPVLQSLREAARAAGATLLACGIHPGGRHGEADLVDAERYRGVEQAVRGLIRRTPEAALHVHVGMPDAETAIRVFNGLRRWLPLLAGLAAGSPFWFGADSGLASARSAIVRAYPGRGVPRAFRDAAEWEEVVEASLLAAGVKDATHLWWDVRVQPRLGTVEVRELDVQPSLEDAAALAALVHGLALLESEPGRPPTPPTEALGWSSFRAARDGVTGEILHGERLEPLRDVAREALGEIRPRLAERGADAPLDGVERILASGGGAAWQRAAHARAGMPGLLAEIVRRTG